MERLRALAPAVEVVHAGREPGVGRARPVDLCDAYLSART
jgi:hypothetical protein